MSSEAARVSSSGGWLRVQHRLHTSSPLWCRDSLRWRWVRGDGWCQFRSLRVQWLRPNSCGYSIRWRVDGPRATADAHSVASYECAQTPWADCGEAGGHEPTCRRTTWPQACGSHLSSRRNCCTFRPRGCGSRERCAGLSLSSGNRVPVSSSTTRRRALASHSTRSRSGPPNRSADAAPRATRFRCDSVPPASGRPFRLSRIRASTRALHPGLSRNTQWREAIARGLWGCTRCADWCLRRSRADSQSGRRGCSLNPRRRVRRA